MRAASLGGAAFGRPERGTFAVPSGWPAGSSECPRTAVARFALAPVLVAFAGRFRMLRLLRLAPAVLAFGGLAVTAAAQQALVHDYTAMDGRHRYAVGLQLETPTLRDGAVQHVVLVDTSASQVGEYRDRGLAVLDAYLAALPSDDRASVVAYDVRPTQVAAAQSPADARTAAAANLATRAPAGSSDMLTAIEMAVSELPSGGVVTLICDGMSVADLVQPSELVPVAATARERGIAIQSFAIGSNVDLQLLGVLANQTGGVVVLDGDESSETLAKQLADAARIQPVAGGTITLTGVDGELIGDALPLRSDRMTYRLAIGEPSSKIGIEYDGRTLDATVRDQGNTFLRPIAGEADATDGVVNPLAGDVVLNAAREAFEREVARLERLGTIAVARQAWRDAETIALEIRRIDPHNVRAVAILEAVGDKTMAMVQFDDGVGIPDAPRPESDDENRLDINGPGVDVDAGEINNDGGRPDIADVPDADISPILDGRDAPRPVDPISRYEELQILAGERLQLEVNQGIEDARAILADDPDGSLAVLQQLRGAVKTASDVVPELRESLLRRLGAEFVDVENRKESILARQQLADNRRAEAEAQERLVEAITIEERRMEQLTDEVAALLEQGRAGNEAAFEEAEIVARIIDSMRPGNAVGAATIFTAEAAGQLDKAYRMRAIRADKFLEQLYQVELSAVPFPDEPPVNYPSAERWQEITEMRRKYKSVDLKRDSPNEQRILEQLDKNTEFAFAGETLKEVMEYVADLHGITILIQEDALAEVGVGTDEPIQLYLAGVTLRSALKILLEPRELTYIIKDEVMQITSADRAGEASQVRVYPVADLVIPIQVIQGGGGGLGGAGGGGAGGGIGGGGAGGGAGGGGGGFFMIPPTVEARDAADSSAKKKAVN